MTRWERQCSAVFGLLTARLAQLAMGAGVLALVVGLALQRAPVVFAALAASWLFFAGISAGGVAVAASIRIAQGRWAREVLPTAEASIGFFVPAFGILMLLTFGAPLWMPWAIHARPAEWLPLAIRDLVLTGILFWSGRRFVRSDRLGDPRIRSAVGYALLYAVTLSVWAVDLVMSLHEWAPSTAIPAYYCLRVVCRRVYGPDGYEVAALVENKVPGCKGGVAVSVSLGVQEASGRIKRAD